MRMPRTYENSRGRILDATERVILRDGLNGASIDAVLREAEISKGGFFHHFASKEALLGAVTERLATLVADEIARAAEADPEPHGRSLRARVAMAFDTPRAVRERTRALVLALLVAASESPGVATAARKANTEDVAVAASEGVEAGTALLVLLALDGYFLAESLGTLRLDTATRAALRDSLLGLLRPAKKGGQRGR